MECCSQFCSVVILLTSLCLAGAHGSQKVKLKDVDTLTLYNGKMTTSRRTNPVPQTRCVGGSAGCARLPQVVQCYNRGSDGSDVQWECKAEMDKDYKFGTLEVFCEGYDYPDDPYVLKGSCGLEYTLEYTGHSSTHSKPNSYSNYTKPKTKGTGFGDLLYIAVAGVIIYIIYKSCISSARHPASDTGYTGDYPDDPHGPSAPPGWGGGGGGFYGDPPPAPGFRPDLGMGGSCGGGTREAGLGGTGGGGFWTGAATGGILGYLLGNRGNTGGSTWGYPREGTWGGSSGFSGFSGPSTSSSPGEHTSTGYGGTRRR